MANDNYVIPFGLNPTEFFKGLNDMEAGFERLEENATTANRSLQGAFNASTQAGQKLNDTIQTDSRSITALREQAEKFGASISQALSGKGIGDQFKARIDDIKKKLGTLTRTAVDIDVDFDNKKIDLLQEQIQKAASATEEFNTVIKFAKDQLAELEPGGQGFSTLQKQIQDAELLVEKLNTAVANTVPTAAILTGEFDRLFGNPSEFLTESELAVLDETILRSTTDTEVLTAQVTALGKKLQTLEPGSGKFQQFTEAVNAGNAALAQMGAETVTLTEQENQQATATQSLRARLREMREELAALEIAGATDSNRFKQLSVQAGELADQIGDTGQRIRVLASDTKYLDAGISAISGLTGAFTAAQGAAALLGDDNEKTQKTIQKVTGALAILQGVQALANALNKDSALSILLLSKVRGADTVAATAETVATEAEAVAAAEGAVATEALAAAEVTATAATTGFTAALLLNPITLIVTAIVLGAAALIKFASATSKAEEESSRLNMALQLEKDLFDDSLKNVQRLTDLRVASANARGAKESEVTKLETDGLSKSLKAQQDYSAGLLRNMDKLEEIRKKDGLDEKDYIQQRDQLSQQYSASRSAETDFAAQIDVKAINQHSQANKEQIALNQALIQEDNSNFSERKKIQGLILASIKDARDEQLKTITNANEKERQSIKNSGADRIQAIKDQIGDLKQTIKENNQEIGSIGQQVGIGEIDPAVASKRIADLNGQNALYAKAISQAGKDIVAVQSSTNKQLEEQEKEHQRKLTELRLAVALAEANAQADSFKKDLDVLEVQHAQELEQIKNQYKDNADLRDRLIIASETAYGIKIKKLTYDNGLKLIDQETQLGELQIEISGKFAKNNVSQQKALQVELLKVRLQGAEERLNALKDDGTEESKIAIAQQKKLIQDLKNELGVAQKDAGQYSLFKLFGLDGLNDDQKGSVMEFAAIAGQAVTSLTDLIVSQYDRQIDAKQKVIDATQSQIDDLEKQLDKENQLMENGYANNVANVESQLALKKKEKDEEIKQQQDLIKKRQAAQKAQLAIDSAAEASGLIVSAVNIFKGFTAAFPVIGVPLAIAAIGLMTGAFVAAKVKAFQAVNDASTQAGASFGEGGFINGKSHTNGGQKYRSIDGNGGVIELEGDEYVVKKSVAQRHPEFLQAFNEERLTNEHLAELLRGTGISLSPEAPQLALTEVTQRNDAQAGSFVMINAGSPDMGNIKESLNYLVERKKADPVYWEDNKYYYLKVGLKTIKFEK